MISLILSFAVLLIGFAVYGRVTEKIFAPDDRGTPAIAINVGIIIKNIILVSITLMLIFVAHAWRNNTMMAYVEHHIYDGTGN